MKTLSKLVLAAGLATSLTLSATPAMAQTTPAGSSNNTTTTTQPATQPQTNNAAIIGSSVGIGVLGLGLAGAAFAPQPLLDINNIQRGFTDPRLAPYAVAFTAGLIAVAGTIGTLIGNAVG